MTGAVRAGVLNQRDRGTKRRRQRRASSLGAVVDPLEALRTAIAALEENVDLEAYLRATNTIELPAAERLRILAIEREQVVSFEALQRIYERALEFDPKDPWLYASYGIAASDHATTSEDLKQVSRLFAIAHDKLAEATARAPEDASIAAARGLARYMDRQCARDEALAAIDHALELDAHEPWARLYRAHLLHDLERWQEAALEYGRVPKDAFDGARSWRIHLLVEQQAWCWLNAGDRSRALAAFERILTRYEAQPRLADAGDLRYLRAAADGEFPQLGDRVRVLAARLDARW